MKEKSNSVKNEKTMPWEAVSPLAVAPAVFLAAFGPGPYGLRSFLDGGGGRGCNQTVTAAELAVRLAALKAENDGERRGIFFVVNPGGHRDAEISGVAAQFVEADALPLESQWDNLMAFPLPPSLVVKTRKSLHGYWLMAEFAELACFTALQKQLAAHFGGDPVISNPSRVMRLPGFNHHKAEPVAVDCLLFEPGRRYTQAQLFAALETLHPDDPRFGTAAASPKAPPRAKRPPAALLSPPQGDFDLARLLKACDFIQYCEQQAGAAVVSADHQSGRRPRW